MKLYIKAISSYRSDLEELEIKKELKQRYKLDTRRQDAFIHLALLGAQRLKDVATIDESDELYITSGVGNIDVLQKTYDYVIDKKEFIRPFDFINMLGNTTSYYVAASLGVKDKNIFHVSDNFTFINSLISIYASLSLSNKSAILGSVDLVSNPELIIKKLLGVTQESEIISSSSYQKLSLNSDNAIAEIEFDTTIYSQKELDELIVSTEDKIMFSYRCKEVDTDSKKVFSETIISSILNQYIQKKSNLIYVDCHDEKYKVLRLNLLSSKVG